MNKIEIPISEKELKVPKEILDAFKSNTSESASKNDTFVNFEVSQVSGEKSIRVSGTKENIDESSMFFSNQEEPKNDTMLQDFDLTDSEKEQDEVTEKERDEVIEKDSPQEQVWEEPQQIKQTQKEEKETPSEDIAEDTGRIQPLPESKDESQEDESTEKEQENDQE